MSRISAVAIATLILGSGAAALFAQSPRTLQRGAERALRLNLAKADYPQLGDANAPVVIVEFSEFGCPYCRKHAGTVLPQIVKKYVDRGDVRYLFVQVPPEGEQGSEDGALALLCAAREGALLPMYQRLFSAQELDREAASAAAAALGLQAEPFASCTGSAEVKDDLARHIEFAKQNGVVGTPTFLIGRSKGGHLVDAKATFGIQPLSFFDSSIDRLLRRASTAREE